MLLLWIVFVENLTGNLNDIVCELALYIYVTESWISPGCSQEFNKVHVQRKKSQ